MANLARQQAIMNKVPRSFNPGMNSPYYFIRHELFNKFSGYAPQLKGKLLDFGCGSKPYQSLFTSVEEYTGLDYEGEGHSHVNEHVDVFYDGKHIPFDDGHFDSVFSSEVFEHLFRLHEILPEIGRVMKNGGRLLISCPFAWPLHEVPVDFARYTPFALKDMLEHYGFNVLSQEQTGDYLMAIHQLRMTYFSEQVIPSIPLLGRSKFFRTSIAPLFYMIGNGWFRLKQALLPKRKEFYMNNIVLAEKKVN